MSSHNKSIIIKHVKKKVGGGHHGGSWKVAYADFVTGMMAFFLMMWLLSLTATDPDRRAQMANYFSNFSLFDQGSISMMDGVGGESVILKESKPEDISTESIPPEQLQEKLREEIQSKLEGLEDQLMVEIFPGGVRIQLVDKAGQSLFPLGGSSPTPLGKKMLEAVAGSIKGVPNKIAIEGHTDALSYSSGRYTNWELSTDRASAARKELELSGLNPDQLAMVAGYAATSPLIKENPNDPRNRRISIIIQYSGDVKDDLNASSSDPLGGK